MVRVALALLLLASATLAQDGFEAQLEAEARVALDDARAELAQVVEASKDPKLTHMAGGLLVHLKAARQLVNALPKDARRIGLSDAVNALALEAACTRRAGTYPNHIPALRLIELRPIFDFGHLRDAKTKAICAVRAVYALRWAEYWRPMNPKTPRAAIAALRDVPAAAPLVQGLDRWTEAALKELPKDALLADGQKPPEGVVIFEERLPADGDWGGKPPEGTTHPDEAPLNDPTPPDGPRPTTRPEPMLDAEAFVLDDTTLGNVTVGIAWCPPGTKVVARHTKPDGTTEVILDEENKKGGVVDSPVELGCGIGCSFAPLRGVHRFECEIRLPDGTTVKRRLAVVAR